MFISGIAYIAEISDTPFDLFKKKHFGYGKTPSSCFRTYFSLVIVLHIFVIQKIWCHHYKDLTDIGCVIQQYYDTI